MENQNQAERTPGGCSGWDARTKRGTNPRPVRRAPARLGVLGQRPQSSQEDKDAWSYIGRSLKTRRPMVHERNSGRWTERGSGARTLATFCPVLPTNIMRWSKLTARTYLPIAYNDTTVSPETQRVGTCGPTSRAPTAAAPTNHSSARCSLVMKYRTGSTPTSLSGDTGCYQSASRLWPRRVRA